MSAEIVHLGTVTCVIEPPEQVLEKAKAWGMDRCLILGFDEDGALHMGGSFSNLAEMVLLLEAGRHRLMSGGNPPWATPR